MTRSLLPLAQIAAIVFFAVVCISAAQRVQHADVQPRIVGRLATVEPADGRITVVPDGEVERVELFVADEVRVALEDCPLTLADLVIQVGRRVTVYYRNQEDRRVADRIIVEPPE